MKYKDSLIAHQFNCHEECFDLSPSKRATNWSIYHDDWNELHINHYWSQNCMAIITNHVGHSLKFLKSPALSWASFSLLFSAIGPFTILMEPHHSSTESYEGGLEIRFKEIKASLQRFIGPHVVGSNFDWNGGKSFIQFMLTVSVPNVMARKEIHENI